VALQLLVRVWRQWGWAGDGQYLLLRWGVYWALEGGRLGCSGCAITNTQSKLSDSWLSVCPQNFDLANDAIRLVTTDKF